MVAKRSYQLVGRGRITRPSGESLEVGYRAWVTQEVLPTIPGQPPVQGMRAFSGILEFDSDPDFEMLGEDLGFELQDGRRLRIFIKSLGKQAEFRVSDAGDLKGEG